MKGFAVIRNLSRLIDYILRYKKTLSVGVMFIILTNLFSVAAPRVLGLAIDYIKAATSALPAVADLTLPYISSDFKIQIFGYVGIIILLAISQGTCRFFMRQTVIAVSRKIEYDLRNDFYAHLQKLSQNYYNEQRTGDLMSRATNDLNAVRMVLGPGIMYSITTVTLFIMCMVLMVQINLKLTLYALSPLTVMSLLVWKIGEVIHRRFEQIQDQLAKLTAQAQENLSGIRVVKAYVREEKESETFLDMNRDYLHKNQKLFKVWALFFPMMQMMSGLGAAIVLGYGGWKVIGGAITLGDFVAFTSYLVMLYWPMIALGWVINVFQRGSASMKRMNAVFEAEPDIVNGPMGKPVHRIYGKIEFRNLTFHYPGTDVDVLQHISLTIEAGKTVSIIGLTGSGKSTFVNLIPRIYDPPVGTVFIDDHEIHEIPIAVLRSHIGMVPQETFLFSEPISENIAHGNPEAPFEEIVHASKTAQLHPNVLEFPKQYETMLGERGVNLSGGQKQRLAIARAIIRDPAILILDDAFSSVDTYTEEEILQNLKQVMEGRTSLIISHRISTIRNADRIIVIRHNTIAEEGTHDELVAHDGLYASLYKKQLLEQELEIE